MRRLMVGLKLERLGGVSTLYTPGDCTKSLDSETLEVLLIEMAGIERESFLKRERRGR